MRVRYETRCGGRLLKVFGQVELPEPGKRQDDWQHVEPDVARAMLAEYGEQP